MRIAFILLGLLMLSPWSILYAQEVYKSGHYTVRKVKDTCKLEILLHKSDQEPAAIMALFPTEAYYGELFTEKKRIGMARKTVRIQFDQDTPRDISFVADAASEDPFWRWQYLENTQGLLGMISRKNRMTVSFKNGKALFEYKVSLKGSSKAVLALRYCREKG